MSYRIFENKIQTPKGESDFENVWDHVRKVWYAQDAALKSLTSTDLAGFRNIVATMLSTEENNTFSPSAIFMGLLFLSSLCSGVTKKEILDVVLCNEANAPKAVENIKKALKRMQSFLPVQRLCHCG